MRIISRLFLLIAVILFSHILLGYLLMDKIKKNWVYYFIIFITFYLIPILIQDTGSGMFILLIVIPLITLITSIIYGLRNVFDFIYPLIVAILFIPTLFIYYNA